MRLRVTAESIIPRDGTAASRHCKQEISALARGSKHSTCSTFPMRGAKIVIPFIQRNLFPLSYSELVAFLECVISDLCAPGQITRSDDTELLPSRREPRSVDQFPPDIDHAPFFPTNFAPRLTLWQNLFTRVARSCPWTHPGCRAHPCSGSCRNSADETGPSTEARDAACRTMTTVHSNIYKHRATKRARLTFDSHPRLSFRSVSIGGKNWSSRREMLPPFAFLSLSTPGLINANRKVRIQLAFDSRGEGSTRSPSPTS